MSKGLNTMVTEEHIYSAVYMANNCLERWLMSPEEIKCANRMVNAGLLYKGKVDNKQGNIFYWRET